VDLPAVLAVAAGYLIGSIDFGVIVPKLAGIDIYGVGSGNPGTTNVLRAMGRKAAAAVLLGDLAKGFAAALLGDLVGGEVVGFAAGFAAVLGHCFPVWHRFRGGKGVATAGGAVLWLVPPAGAVLLAVWVGIVALAKRSSVASLLVAAGLVPVVALFGGRGVSLAWAGATAALIVGRHHANIRRLVTGEESAVEEGEG
jgi:glycerol-3-phosphate acyltransferase PlsY